MGTAGMTTNIRIPRPHIKRVKALDSWSELNRWGGDIDARINEIIASLGDTQRAIREATRTTGAATLGLHAATHRPTTGADRLGTAAPTSTLGGTSSNSVGTGDSFARNDHSHDVSTAVPTIGWSGSAAAEGTGNPLLRADATLLAPPLLRSTANASTLTLTDDATNQTLTGSLGRVTITPANNEFQLAWWNSAGADTPTPRDVLRFNAASSVVGDILEAGVVAFVTWNDSTAKTSRELFAGQFAPTTASGPVYTTCTIKALDLGTQSGAATLSGTHSFTKRLGIDLIMGSPSGSSVTTTDFIGFDIRGWPIQIVNVPIYTNAHGIRIEMPRVGGTIRRGLTILSSTGNTGTVPANEESIYLEDLTRGSALRRTVAAEGATTGTPTDVVILDQATAHAVGTNRYFLRGLNASTLSNPSGIAQTVLGLSQLNTGATAGAHLNLNDKAGDPASPATGDLWRNGNRVYYKHSIRKEDLIPSIARTMMLAGA